MDSEGISEHTGTAEWERSNTHDAMTEQMNNYAKVLKLSQSIFLFVSVQQNNMLLFRSSKAVIIAVVRAFLVYQCLAYSRDTKGCAHAVGRLAQALPVLSS